MFSEQPIPIVQNQKNLEAAHQSFLECFGEERSLDNYLQQFNGSYETIVFARFHKKVSFSIRTIEKQLYAIYSPTVIYKLVPIQEDEFSLEPETKNSPAWGSIVRFIWNEHQKIEKIVLVHPYYGEFSAFPIETPL